MGAIIDHTVYSAFFMDFWSIWIGPRDVLEIKAEVLRELGREDSKPTPAKYSIGYRVYHLAIVTFGLAVSASGIFMLSRVRNWLLTRNQHLLADFTYVLHGLVGLGLVGLVIAHMYFAIRPERWWITKAMIFRTILDTPHASARQRAQAETGHTP